MRNYWIVGCLLLLVSAVQAQEQSAFPYRGTAEDSVDMEKRGKVVQIRERLLNEIAAGELFKTSVQKMESSLYLLGREPEAEARIRGYLVLNHQVKDKLNELQDMASRQVELSGMIDVAMAAGGLLPQVAGYLEEARNQLRQMGVNQAAHKKNLQKMQSQIRLGVRNIPAPEEFTARSGLVFRLVQGGKEPFYVSKSTLGTGNSDYESSLAKLDEFSKRDGIAYRFPRLPELRVLAQQKRYPEFAVWSGDDWGNANSDDQRMLERFGVKMVLVWDPQMFLKRGRTLGELPFARYPRLDAVLVAPVRAGWQTRWDKVIAEMNAGK